MFTKWAIKHTKKTHIVKYFIAGFVNCNGLWLIIRNKNISGKLTPATCSNVNKVVIALNIKWILLFFSIYFLTNIGYFEFKKFLNKSELKWIKNII